MDALAIHPAALREPGIFPVRLFRDDPGPHIIALGVMAGTALAVLVFILANL